MFMIKQHIDYNYIDDEQMRHLINIVMAKVGILFLALLWGIHASCPTHQFLDNGNCQPCQNKCMNCEYQSDNCTQCYPNSNRILGNNECYPEEGYYDDGNSSAKSCESPCVACSSKLTCSTCISGYTIDVTDYCVECRSIIDDCKICEDNITCVECDNLFFLENITDLNSTTNSSICTACPDNCFLCEDFDGCTQCNSFYYLQNGNNNTLNSTINSTICVLCPDDCHTCEDFYGCIQCIDFYYLEISTNITSGNTSTICYQCPNNCTTCQDYKGCTQCDDAFYSQIAINSTNNITQTFCYPCPQNCTQCDNYNTCTSCKDKFYLENSTNMTTGVDDIVCSPCAYECSLCQREDYCTECINKYYQIVDDFCVDLCGDSYVIDVECDRGVDGGYGCNADCTVKDQYQCLTFDHQSFCEYVGSIDVDMGSIEKADFQNMMEVQLTIKPQLEQYYQVTGPGNMTTGSSEQGLVGGAEFDKMFSYTCNQKHGPAQLTYDQEGGISVLVEFQEDMQDQSFVLSYHSYHGLANNTWEFVAATHPLQLLVYSAGQNEYAKFLFYFGYVLVGLGWLICVVGVMAPSRLAGLEFIFLLQYCFVTLLWMEDYLYLPLYSLRPFFYSTGYYHTFSTGTHDYDYPPQAFIFQLPHQTFPFNLMGFLWVVPFIIIIINAIRYLRGNGDESRLALLLQLQKFIEVFFYVTMFNLISFTNACVVYYSEGDMSDQASQAIVGVCGFAMFVSWVAFVIWQPSFRRFRFAFRIGCLSFYHYCLLGSLLVGSVLLTGLVPQYGWLPLIPQFCMVVYLAINRPYNVTSENARAIFYALIMCIITAMKIYWSFDPHSHRSTNSYIFPGVIEGLLFLALLWAFFSVIYDYACEYCFSITPQKQRIYDLLDEKQTLQKIKNTMLHSNLLTKESPVTTYQQEKSNESQHSEKFSEKFKQACKAELAQSPTALKVFKEEIIFLKFQKMMDKKDLFSEPVQIETLKDYDAI